MAESGRNVCAFEGFELDSDRFELRRDGTRIPVEPQVLALLILLATNRERMVDKDEIIAKVWDGRIVSESAVAARIKAARRAIGDDGKQQRLIRTIHGRGFRFVGDVTDLADRAPALPRSPLSPAPACPPPLPSRDGRPSIAVLPFALLGEPGPHDIVADALPADIIMDLARLPWLFVIARGSSFRFRGTDEDPIRAGRELAVGYCLTGAIELSGQSVRVSVALSETGRGETLWGEKYQGSLGELQHMRPEIEGHVVSALEAYIPRHEVRLARTRPAGELDAWARFHLGLDHMYRFTPQDNALAAAFFAQALELEPYFARALGGLSFTHFQNAFMRFGEDPAVEAEAARTLAQRAVETDRIDPFAHFNMGRSLWLDGQLDDSIAWFDRATGLSPNYAQGIYNRGLVETMVGKVAAADADLALALELSPLDPLAYAMVSSRALIQIQLDNYEAGAELAARAAKMPGAHKHIALIAALAAELAGRRDEATNWLVQARKADPNLNADIFFRSFPFAQTHGREVIERTFAKLGI